MVGSGETSRTVTTTFPQGRGEERRLTDLCSLPGQLSDWQECCRRSTLPTQLGHRQGCELEEENFPCPFQADLFLKPLLFPLSSIPGGTVEQLHSAAKIDNPNASHKLPPEPHWGLQGQTVFCCSPSLSGTHEAAREPDGFITIKPSDSHAAPSMPRGSVSLAQHQDAPHPAECQDW